MAQFFGSNYRSLHCFMQSKRVHPAFHKSLDGQAAWSHGVAETVEGSRRHLGHRHRDADRRSSEKPSEGEGHRMEL